MNDIALSQKEAIDRLQEQMLKLPQTQLPTQHFFADGMYCRYLPRPAGCLIVGKVHKKEHFYMVVSGKVRVSTDDGVVDISAPNVIVSRAGTKRAVFALEDSVCLTVHRLDTQSQDLDEIENELIEADGAALFDASNSLKFDVPAFRELTQRVINAEKVGFWSDWTIEQQDLYQRGDWKAFSKSRGYTDEEIEEYGEWRASIFEAKALGLNPYSFIDDVAQAAALENIRRDTRGEILKSSHAPFESRKTS